ncbi:hypothetical protein Pla175_09350 [Pirellulimonas nuda]|uniref:Uncharacterized protein n=1 Tax=Pirellulimonas nuda TaxID=2528009 RepID=A0A518D7Z5_9BACT|nr:hypothetical protein [Pirellulimonas nuda]QDU87570.1 hypothetical protein Pla175_09350 [Pirellulimonas nuda]
MRYLPAGVLTLAVLACVLPSPWACAAPESAFGGLGGAPLEGGVADLLRATEPEAPPADADAPPAIEPGLLERLLQGGPAEGGEDLGQPAANPLDGIQSKMQRAESLINARDVSGDVGKVQQQVVDDLDELIKKAEEQCKNCQSGKPGKPGEKQASQRSKPKPGSKPGPPQQANQNSQAPAKTSSTRLGDSNATGSGGRPPEELMKEVWGRLPARMREQMLQSSPDEFLPEYREEIEAYYRELAAEPVK